jgi:hypothetical protein
LAVLSFWEALEMGSFPPCTEDLELLAILPSARSAISAVKFFIRGKIGPSSNLRKDPASRSGLEFSFPFDGFILYSDQTDLCFLHFAPEIHVVSPQHFPVSGGRAGIEDPIPS